jgi:beta-1,4-mannosyl-glycoprotein beta-1,4-N-acetylglucosaminyltransferase
LMQCKPDDLIIISDLDEIPTPEQITANKTKTGVQTFRQMNFYYFLNCRSVDDSERWWYGTVMAHYKDFRKAQDFRTVSKAMNADHGKILKNKYHRLKRALVNPILWKEITIIDKGGWHFGFLGGVKKIIEKLEAFSHDEYNKPEFKNEETIIKAINSGNDILGRGLYCEFIPIDESYPDYLLKSIDRYSHLIKAIKI